MTYCNKNDCMIKDYCKRYIQKETDYSENLYLAEFCLINKIKGESDENNKTK